MPKVDINEELGQVIKELRVRKGMNSAKLAEGIKKSVGFISNVENSKIKSIDINDLINIFEFLISDESERSTIIEDILSNLSVRYTAKELQEKKWFEVYDKEYRLLPISKEYAAYLADSLKNLNISSLELVRIINSNHGVTEEKLPFNKVIIRYENERMSLRIRYKLKDSLVQDIIDGIVTKSNYITLQGIVYNIKCLEGLDDYESYTQSERILNNLKIYTSIELKKLMQDAQLNAAIESITNAYKVNQDKLPDENIKNIELLTQIVQQFKVLADSDVAFMNEQLSSFANCLQNKETISFMINLIGLPFCQMTIVSPDKRKQFFKNIKKELDDLLSESNKVETEKIELEKY